MGGMREVRPGEHRQVRVSPEVYERLQKLAQPGETPNAVLRRLYGLPANQQRPSRFKKA